MSPRPIPSAVYAIGVAALAACAPGQPAQLTVGHPTSTTADPAPVPAEVAVTPSASGRPGPTPTDSGGVRESVPVPSQPPNPLPVAHLGQGAAATDDVEWLVRQTFPEDPDHAASIAWCESRMRPDAGFPAGPNLGVMQIAWPAHAALVASMGYGHDDLANPIVNLAVARRLYEAAG